MKYQNNLDNTIKVLHIDDEIDFLDITKIFLEKLSKGALNIESLANPEKALHQLRLKNYDIVVCDYLLPKINGLHILAELRNNFSSKLPFIMFTGQGREEVAIQALNQGANYYIKKGEDVESQYRELLHIIQSVVKQSRVEKALEKSERNIKKEQKLFKAVIESTAEGMLVVNDKGKVLHSNSRFKEMWQIPQKLLETRDDQQLLEYVLSQLKHPDKFLSKVTQLYKSLLKDFDIIYFKDGRIYERFSSPLIQNDKIIGRIWSFKDITELENAKKAIQQNESRYHAIFKESPIALWEVDMSEVKIFLDDLGQSGITDFRAYFDANPEDVIACAKMSKVLDVNQKTLDIYHAASKEELLGSLDKTFNEESYISFKEELIDFAYGKTFYKAESVGVKLNGEKIPINIGVNIPHEYKQTFSRTLVSIEDITSQRRAKLELQRNQQFMQTMLEHSPTVIYAKDLDGHYLLVNKAFSDQIELTQDKIIGKTDYDLISHKVAEIYRANDQLVVQQNKAMSFEEEVQIGDKVLFNLSVKFPLYDTKGNVYGICGISTDISALKQTENELKRQKNELSDFAHYFSHDMRNILTNIAGYSTLLSQNYDKDSVQKILHQTKMMQSLLKNSLQLADAGLIINKIDVVNLRFLVQEAFDMVITKDVTIMFNDMPEILCDRHKTLLIFKNLLENAIIHGKPKNISIDYQKTPINHFITISNDGIPIPDEIIHNIFKRGYSTGKSTGLGLNIVEKLVKAHNWHITVESTPELTSFTLEIPKQKK